MHDRHEIERLLICRSCLGPRRLSLAAIVIFGRVLQCDFERCQLRALVIHVRPEVLVLLSVQRLVGGGLVLTRGRIRVVVLARIVHRPSPLFTTFHLEDVKVKFG